MENEEIVNKPIFFERNRVYRVYKGGAPYREFFNTNEEGDNNFPEEWIASSVKAINSVYFSERDGVSKVRGTNIYFDDLLKENRKELLGNRKYDILIKFLDSAIRLPMQVHPTKDFSRKHFNSEFGKTESWYVIATRPNAKLYFGFNKKYSKEDLIKFEEESEYDKNIWESAALSVDVKPGDCFIIHAGLIHAIGYGCTVIEVQEPTDFTIQPERWCGDLHLSEKDEFLGLTIDEAMDCFNLDLIGEKAINKSRITPKEEIVIDGYKKENLVTYNDTTCFRTNRHTLTKGSFKIGYCPSVWIVEEGEGLIYSENENYNLKRGDYFFMPFITENKYSIKTNSMIRLVECLPSKQD